MENAQTPFEETPEPAESIQAPISDSPVAPSETSPILPVASNKRFGGLGKTIGVIVILLILTVGFVTFFSSRTEKDSDGDAAFSGVSILPSKLERAYSLDTDKDHIPNVLEEELGYDPVTSELDRCAVESCASVGKVSAKSSERNILFIIDSSGSMALTTGFGNTTKMDAAKEAITKFVATVKPAISVGIMEYGHKGSNSASDKALSCASAEIIAPIGSVTASSIDKYLSQIEPVGWTPIGLAIRNGQEAFSGKEGQKNQIIIVTDGVETCASTPVAAAKEVQISELEISVDVIGFAVNTSEQSSLKAIAESGGGLFSVANTSSELLKKFQAYNDNYASSLDEAMCNIDAHRKSSTCLHNIRMDVSTYLKEKRTDYKGRDNTYLTKLSRSIFDIYSKGIDDIN